MRLSIPQKVSGQEKLDGAMDGVRKQIAAAVRGYDDTGNEFAFGGALRRALRDGHVQAAILGRQTAGDLADAESDDEKFGELAVQADDPYIAAFVSDLGSGRYIDDHGQFKIAAIERRARVYANRMAATANETFCLASAGQLIAWMLGDPVTVHCDVCPERAAAGPYRAEEMPGFPGDCSTPCLFNCLCWLEREDGTRGFHA